MATIFLQLRDGGFPCQNTLKDLDLFCKIDLDHLTLLHSERPKLYTVLAFLSAVGLTAKLHQTDVHFGSKGQGSRRVKIGPVYRGRKTTIQQYN